MDDDDDDDDDTHNVQSDDLNTEQTQSACRGPTPSKMEMTWLDCTAHPYGYYSNTFKQTVLFYQCLHVQHKAPCWCEREGKKGIDLKESGK